MLKFHIKLQHTVRKCLRDNSKISALDAYLQLPVSLTVERLENNGLCEQVNTVLYIQTYRKPVVLHLKENKYYHTVRIVQSSRRNIGDRQILYL